MNIKKSLAGLIAGFALLGSIAAPSALATTGNVAIVEVSNGGSTMIPGVCSVNMHTNSNPTANSDGDATGTINVCYTNDTLSFRQHFTASLSAEDFTSGSYTISASNFIVTRTHSVHQAQCTFSCGTVNPNRIGDIGFLDATGAHGPNQSDPTSYVDWTGQHSLDGTGQAVHFGYAGRGTVSSDGDVDVKLTIPAGTREGSYQSELTVTVTYDASLNP